ncbi:MAG: hypothetical protein PF569_08800 [Candidatus Woesearchaeota archaeon]|jgi:hypothetical protein|nr:hypothetical protein [Candidatus Woesearchaeota archaeon]
MDKSQIRDYVSKYKDTYSKDSIKSQLINSGASADEFESVYTELSGRGSVFPSEMRSGTGPEKKKSHVGLIIGIVFLVLVIIGALVVFVGLPMWQESYSSGLVEQVDRQSVTSSGISVEMVQANGDDAVAYLKNPGTTDINADITISECDVTQEIVITPGIATQGYTLMGCDLASGLKVTVVVKTSDAIYRESEIVSN